MLMNNLDPEVAERPQDLVVYGGIGKAARNWECFDAHRARAARARRTTRRCSCSPASRWASSAPTRTRRASSSPTPCWCPRWATWEHFYELDRKGLMMYGQMTAGSWIYIGTQGILQGTYETFAEAARQHFGGSLEGRLVVTAGLGGMGGAQPLAATMNEGVLIAVEVDRHRIERRLETRYLDVLSRPPRRGAARGPARRQAAGRPLSIGLLGNAADVLPELVRRGVVPDLVTDQTSAHDPAERLRPEPHVATTRRSRLRASDPGTLHGGGPAQHGRARAGDAGPQEARSRRRSTTATTSAPRRRRPESRTPSTSPASCPPTSVRSSARARGRSAGPCSPATRRTSP